MIHSVTTRTLSAPRCSIAYGWPVAGRVYVAVGDGEQEEGVIWEAAMAAAAMKADNHSALLVALSSKERSPPGAGGQGDQRFHQGLGFIKAALCQRFDQKTALPVLIVLGPPMLQLAAAAGFIDRAKRRHPLRIGHIDLQ